MSLDHAILGFLNYKPFSGYDLKKIFDISIRHFWAADQSQIYRTLARLAEQGLAEPQHVEQTDRPDRKIYHITDKGRAELVKWVGGPFPIQSSHSGPLVQVFFAGVLSDEQVRAKFEDASAFFRGALSQYSQVPVQVEELMDGLAGERERYFWMLTLELGTRMMQAQLEWAEKVVAFLEAGSLPGNDHEKP